MWPLVTPAQVQTFEAMNIRSVEDVEALTDGDIEHCPPGTRTLRDKAAAWRESAEDIGKVAEEVAALRQQLRIVRTELDEAMVVVSGQRADLKKMEVRITEAETPKTFDCDPTPSKSVKVGDLTFKSDPSEPRARKAKK
jgi:malonyl CoA-acyl carrier protein transacylase